MLVFSSLIKSEGWTPAAQSGVNPLTASPGSKGKPGHDLQLYSSFFFKYYKALITIDCIEYILLGSPINTETIPLKK